MSFFSFLKAGLLLKPRPVSPSDEDSAMVEDDEENASEPNDPDNAVPAAAPADLPPRAHDKPLTPLERIRKKMAGMDIADPDQPQAIDSPAMPQVSSSGRKQKSLFGRMSQKS